MTRPDDDDDYEPFGPDYHDVYDEDDSVMEFADPGGNSALRAASPTNPRDQPCPSCERPNLLTRKDKALGYQCDRCADRAEHGLDP